MSRAAYDREGVLCVGVGSCRMPIVAVYRMAPYHTQGETMFSMRECVESSDGEESMKDTLAGRCFQRTANDVARPG